MKFNHSTAQSKRAYRWSDADDAWRIANIENFKAMYGGTAVDILKQQINYRTQWGLDPRLVY